MNISADTHGLEMLVKNNEIYYEKFLQCVKPVMQYFGADFVYMDCVFANGEYWGNTWLLVYFISSNNTDANVILYETC